MNLESALIAVKSLDHCDERDEAFEVLKRHGHTRAWFPPGDGAYAVEALDHVRSSYEHPERSFYRHAKPEFATGRYWSTSRLWSRVSAFPGSRLHHDFVLTLPWDDPQIIAELHSAWGIEFIIDVRNPDDVSTAE